jgi:hypothetical protein
MGFAESEKLDFTALRQEVQSKVNDSLPGWLGGQRPLPSLAVPYRCVRTSNEIPKEIAIGIEFIVVSVHIGRGRGGRY